MSGTTELHGTGSLRFSVASTSSFGTQTPWTLWLSRIPSVNSPNSSRNHAFHPAAQLTMVFGSGSPTFDGAGSSGIAAGHTLGREESCSRETGQGKAASVEHGTDRKNLAKIRGHTELSCVLLSSQENISSSSKKGIRTYMISGTVLHDPWPGLRTVRTCWVINAESGALRSPLQVVFQVGRFWRFFGHGHLFIEDVAE